jgi:hypothetical protein
MQVHLKKPQSAGVGLLPQKFPWLSLRGSIAYPFSFFTLPDTMRWRTGDFGQ